MCARENRDGVVLDGLYKCMHLSKNVQRHAYLSLFKRACAYLSQHHCYPNALYLSHVVLRQCAVRALRF
jgi:hypothetical protein